MPGLEINDNQTIWRRRRADDPLVVLLHGRGSGPAALIGLAERLPPDVSYAAVSGPIASDPPGTGSSWYGIRSREIAATGDSAEITAAARALLTWLDDVAPVDRPVALVGFSQGGVVATQALRLDPERVGAVVNLAGFVAPGQLPLDDQLRAARASVFWGLGDDDRVVPHALVERTEQWLTTHTDATVRRYPGLSHEIDERELRDVHTFLDTWLAGRS